MGKDIEVNIDASKRFGVFCDREFICHIGGDIPEEYQNRMVIVRFPSGLQLDCIGKNVSTLAAGRK